MRKAKGWLKSKNSGKDGKKEKGGGRRDGGKKVRKGRWERKIRGKD